MKGRSRPRRSSAAVLRGAGSHATFDHVVVGGRHSVGTRLHRERTQGGGHRDSLRGGSNPRQALFASGVTRGAAREWPGECGATREARQRRKKVAISHATGDTVQRRGSQRRVCFRVCFPRRSRSAERKKPRLLRWQRESVVVSRTSAFRVRDSVRVTERACDRFRFRT